MNPTKPTPPGAARPRLVVLKGVSRPALLPYVVLVVLLLAVGSVALLLLNTALNSGDFTRERLQQQQTSLDQRTDELRQQLQQESAPNALASRAARLGMVQVPDPAFLDPVTGKVLGDAKRATAPPSPAASSTPNAGGAVVPNGPGATNGPAALVVHRTSGTSGPSFAHTAGSWSETTDRVVLAAMTRTAATRHPTTGTGSALVVPALRGLR